MAPRDPQLKGSPSPGERSPCAALGGPRSAPGPLSHPQVPPAWWPRCAPPVPGSGGCSRGCSRPPAAHQPVAAAAAAAAAAVSGSEPEKRRASRPRGGGGAGRALPARSPAAPGAGAPAPAPRRSSLPRARPTYALAPYSARCDRQSPATKPAGSGSALVPDPGPGKTQTRAPRKLERCQPSPGALALTTLESLASRPGKSVSRGGLWISHRPKPYSGLFS